MPQRDFVSAKELLPALLGKLAREGGPARALQIVWEQEAGPQLAQHARVLGLQVDVLAVQVRGSAWAQALQRQETLLCERLSRRLGPPGVRRLRFQVV